MMTRVRSEFRQRVRLFPAIPTVMLVLLVMSGCGSETNIMGHLVTDSQKDQFYVLVGTSKAAFDAQDYDKAIEAGERAWAIDPGSEDASIALGFAYLGKAGVAPFDLAKGLIASNSSDSSEESEESEESTETSGKQKDDNEDEDANSEVDSQKSKGASGVLGSLTGVLGISDADIAKLGTLDSESDPDIPILIPLCAYDARLALKNLETLNKAVEVICPFVSDSVRLEEDYRHACTKTSRPQKQRGKADFLWAFAHLTEAIAFDKVINYKTTDSSKTNLELRMEAIEGKEVEGASQLAAFVTEVDSLKQAIDKILPVDGVCESQNPQTQFQGMLNDLVATTLAFAAVPGIPEDFTTSLEESMADIIALRNNATSSAGGSESSGALKGDVTSEISGSLAEKIDEVNSSQNLSAEELSELCASYDAISGGSDGAGPKACEGV